MSDPQIWLCLFTFWPIASKQLNGLTTIDILSWLGGAVVTHPLWVQGSRVQSPAPARVFMFDFCIVVVVFLLFLSKNTLFIAKYCNSFYNVNLFSILNVLQDLWPIIRVKRYRPSIFKRRRYLMNTHVANILNTVLRLNTYYCQILFVLYLLLFLKIFVTVKDILEIHVLKNIKKKKLSLLKPDLRIRTHAQSDFIRSKT